MIEFMYYSWYLKSFLMMIFFKDFFKYEELCKVLEMG